MSLRSLPSTPAEDPVFVNPNETKKYQCILHGGILRDAVQTECGHRFCASCIQSLLQSAGQLRCPASEEDCVDLSSEETINPDSSARREILNLQVFCNFKEFGCQETMPWKNLQNHEESCKFRKVKCTNSCGEFVSPSALQEHLQNKCKKRPVSCKDCGATVIFDVYQNHVATDCPGALIPCPHRCPTKPFPRGQLPQHLELCPNKPKPCKFRSAGCKFEGSSEEALRKHEAENVHGHLDLLTVLFSSVEMSSMEMRTTIQALQTQRDSLTSQLGVQKEKNKEMAKQMEKLQTNNKDLQVRVVTLAERLITMEKKMDEFAKKDEVHKCSEEVKIIHENLLIYERRLASLEGTGGGVKSNPALLGTVGVGDIKTRLDRHEQQLGIQDVRLAEMDIRFQIMETSSYGGILKWKIRDFKRRKQEAINGKTISLYSQPFYTDRFGYKMCARVYLNGDGMGKGTHLSLFFVVMRGEFDTLLRWPFQARVNLILLDQAGARHNLSDSFHADITSSSFRKPVTEMNIASGCPLFALQTAVERPPYLVDDTIFIQVEVNLDP